MVCSLEFCMGCILRPQRNKMRLLLTRKHIPHRIVVRNQMHYLILEEVVNTENIGYMAKYIQGALDVLEIDYEIQIGIHDKGH